MTRHGAAAAVKHKRVLLLFNTTRMVPGPPSTGVAIAMDGGMAGSGERARARVVFSQQQQHETSLV